MNLSVLILKDAFCHWVTNLKIVDLSGSGFSVKEDENNAVLLPGMILPEPELSFSNSFNVRCKAQVVYRKAIDDKRGGNWVKYGDLPEPTVRTGRGDRVDGCRQRKTL